MPSDFSGEYVTTVVLTSATIQSPYASNALAANKLSGVLGQRLSSEFLEVALVDASLSFTFNNVAQPYQNDRQISYTWIDGTVVPVPLPAGFYTANSLSQYLTVVMQQQGHYLQPGATTSGPNLYFITLQADTAAGNRTLLTCLAVPSTLPAGYSIPTGGASPAWTLPNPPATPPSRSPRPRPTCMELRRHTRWSRCSAFRRALTRQPL